MKKRLFLIIAALLLVAMVLPACKAAPAEVTEWEMVYISSPMEPQHPEEAAVFAFCDYVWEKSGHTLKINPTSKKVLGYKGKEVMDLIAKNAIQIATTTGGYYAGEEPVLDCTGLMLQFGVDEIATAMAAGRPYFEEVWDRHNAILLGNGAFPNALWSKKPLKKLEDFAGVKFRCTAVPVQRAWESYGGASVAVTWGDIYMSLQTGIIDSIAHALFSGIPGHYYEITKYCIVDPIINAGSIHLIMSKDAFNALPKKTQDMLINDAGPEGQRLLITKLVPSQEQIDFLTGKGVDCYALKGAELDRIRSGMAIPEGLKYADEKGMREAVDAVNKAVGLKY